MKRRTFLIAAAGGTGALLVGWQIAKSLRPSSPDSFDGNSGRVSLNGWIEITKDGNALLAVPRCEMGQGVYTALAMLAAEELDLPIEKIHILEANVRSIYGQIIQAESLIPALNPDQRWTSRGKRWLKELAGRQTMGVSSMTAGSTAIRELWLPIRTVSAQARATLILNAAKLLGANAGQCRTEAGFVVVPDGTKISYADVLSRATSMEQARDFQLKEPVRFSLAGRRGKRLDSLPKCTGQAIYASDVRIPGVRFAALAMAPSFGAKIKSFHAPPGAQVLRVSAGYGQDEALAVIAGSWWTAQKIAKALVIEWDESASAATDSDDLKNKRKEALAKEMGTVRSSVGDVDAATTAAIRNFEAEYEVPYLAHAAMETMNCTAQVADGRVRLWAPVQVPQAAIAAAAATANVGIENVELTVPYLGGGFGRRLDIDFVHQAVAIAIQMPGTAIQLIWTREQEFQHDFYRPAATARMRAGADGNGKLLFLDMAVATEPLGSEWYSRLNPGKAEAAEVRSSGGLAYRIENQRCRQLSIKTSVPVGFWRSVSASYDGFFVESFVEEIAAALQRDPIEMRRELLVGQSRHIETLTLAVEKSGYSPERQRQLKLQGRAMGCAIFEAVGSVVAQVVEVSLIGPRPQVHHVVCAIHCGFAVNPDGIAQQVEGAITMAIGAALDAGIEIRKGRVMQATFGEYPLPAMRDNPIIETHIVKSIAAPTGVGEAAVPPVAAAIANAVFVLSGRRLRSLPLRLD